MNQTNKRHRLIKGLLAMNGVTFAMIARECSVSRQMVAAVVKGDRRSAKVEPLLIKYGIPESLVRAV